MVQGHNEKHHFDLGESLHHFLITCSWDALNANVNLTKVLVNEHKNMFESRISAGASEKLLESEKMVQM